MIKDFKKYIYLVEENWVIVPLLLLFRYWSVIVQLLIHYRLFRYCFIIVPFLFSYWSVIVRSIIDPLLFSHWSVIVPLLFRYWSVIDQSLISHCSVIVPLLFRCPDESEQVSFVCVYLCSLSLWISWLMLLILLWSFFCLCSGGRWLQSAGPEPCNKISITINQFINIININKKQTNIHII